MPPKGLETVYICTREYTLYNITYKTIIEKFNRGLELLYSLSEHHLITLSYPDIFQLFKSQSHHQCCNMTFLKNIIIKYNRKKTHLPIKTVAVSQTKCALVQNLIKILLVFGMFSVPSRKTRVKVFFKSVCN